MTSSTSCSQKSARHPKYWMIGDPSETPRTGPPAPTSDHHPIAFTRSSWGNEDMMSAIEAVPVAAPCTPSRVRARMRMPAVGAIAVNTAETIAPSRPTR